MANKNKNTIKRMKRRLQMNVYFSVLAAARVSHRFHVFGESQELTGPIEIYKDPNEKSV